MYGSSKSVYRIPEINITSYVDCSEIKIENVKK